MLIFRNIPDIYTTELSLNKTNSSDKVEVTFIPAFTTNAMTSDFLSISPGWVVMSLDSHRTGLTFRGWLHLLGFELAFSISILKIFKSIQDYWHRVTDITSFEKHSESSSGHTLSSCQNLVKCRFYRNLSPDLLWWSCLQTKGSKAQRISSCRARK